jgi:hypothetical protein
LPLFAGLMRWLLNLIKSVFAGRPTRTDRSALMGMYLNESNSLRKRKPNRERA